MKVQKAAPMKTGDKSTTNAYKTVAAAAGLKVKEVIDAVEALATQKAAAKGSLAAYRVIAETTRLGTKDVKDAVEELAAQRHSACVRCQCAKCVEQADRHFILMDWLDCLSDRVNSLAKDTK